MKLPEEKYLEWMNEFFHEEDKNDPENYSEWVSYLLESKSNDKLFLLWESVLHGRLGMRVRNYMREHHPEIDDDVNGYGEFEDYSWELIQKLLEKIENGEIN